MILLVNVLYICKTGSAIFCQTGYYLIAQLVQCYFHYATSFIPGAGITVGEILEMLWSSLNAITPTVHTATLAHWADIIDAIPLIPTTGNC